MSDNPAVASTASLRKMLLLIQRIEPTQETSFFIWESKIDDDRNRPPLSCKISHKDMQLYRAEALNLKKYHTLNQPTVKPVLLESSYHRRIYRRHRLWSSCSVELDSGSTREYFMDVSIDPKCPAIQQATSIVASNTLIVRSLRCIYTILSILTRCPDIDPDTCSWICVITLPGMPCPPPAGKDGIYCVRASAEKDNTVTYIAGPVVSLGGLAPLS